MKPPRNKAEALQAVCHALRAAQPVPRHTADWLAEGIDWFLDNPGSSLDEALMLKPRPGGAHETVWRQKHYTERNAILHKLAATIDGVSWPSAQKISRWLREMTASNGVIPEEPTIEQVYYLVQAWLMDSPASDSRLWDILKQTAHLH